MFNLSSFSLHILLLFLVRQACCLESFGMQIDEITGDVLKPYGMSPERFRQLQTLRVKEFLEKGKNDENEIKKKEDNVKRRRKRAVVDTTPTVVPQGFYKQDSLMINPLTGVVENTAHFPRVVAGLVKIGDYFSSDTVTKLRFVVIEPAGDDDVDIKVEKFDGASWTEVTPLDADNSFSNFVKFATVPGAKVSDIEIGNNPKSEFNFVCVTISYELPYPRTVGGDVIDIEVNEPMEYPEAANSILFRFSLNSDGTSYELQKQIDLQGESIVQTYDAKDCEFWVFDGRLMLGIAHSGNTQTDKKQTRSLLYYQEKRDAATFVSMYPEEDDYTLATHGAVKLSHYEINGRSCVIFINNDLSVTESPIFCYYFDQGKYLLEQKIKSFGAKDVATLSIHDTYPIHSHFFIIVCNYQESHNGILTNVSPTIYKYYKGRFAVFQTLPEINHCVDVTTVAKQGEAVTPEDDLPLYKTTQFDHLVGFLHSDSEDFSFYQFDGKKFIEGINVNTLMPNSVLETVDMSTDANSPDYNIMTMDADLKYLLLKPQFGDTPYKSSLEKEEKLRTCLLQSVDRIKNQNFDDLYKEFLKSPTKFSLPDITVNDICFSTPSSVTIDEVSIQSDGDETVILQVDGLNEVDSSYPALVEGFDTQMKTASLALNNFKDDVQGPNYAKVGVTNEFTGSLKVLNSAVNTLKGDVAEFSSFHVTDSTTDYVANYFTENMLLIDGTTAATEFKSGHLIEEALSFDNIKVENGYLVSTLNTVSVDKYVSSKEGTSEIDGTLILSVTNDFSEGIVATKVNDKTFSSSTLLLRSGVQTLDQLVFNSHVTADKLDVEEINGVDLMITKNSVMIGDEMEFGEVVNVKGLTINGKVTRSDLKIDNGTPYTVDIDDLLTRHMRKSVENIVKVEHHYVDAEGTLASSDLTNWPTDYVDSSTGELTFADITFDDITVIDGGVLSVTQKLIDRDDGYEIDVLGDTDLPFISLAESVDKVQVTSPKTMKSLSIDASSTMSGTLQGFNLNDIKEASGNQKLYPGEFTLPVLKINGDTQIKNLKLHGVLKTKCKDSCIENQVGNVYSNAILLNSTSIENANLHFKKIIFNQDVSVTDINDIDPENNFILLDGDDAKTLSNINFYGGTTFNENLIQSTDDDVSACQLTDTKRVLCSPENCPEVTSDSDKCEKVDDQCVIKAGEEDSSLCQTILTHKLHYMWGHYQKENIIFHGGVEAEDILVKSLTCAINDVTCTNIANRKMEESFGGNNIFHTTTSLKTDASITNLQVNGEVNLVNIDHMYTDTLYINSPDPQNVNNMEFQGSNFQISAFTSNDISIGTTAANDIKNRNNHVFNEDAEVTINSQLNFNNLTVSSFYAAVIEDESNTVDMSTFFNNKITTQDDQVLKGAITVVNDLTINGHIIKATDSQPKIDGLDLEVLNQDAVKVDDADIILNNVNFENVAFLNVNGIEVSGNFLGVKYPDDVVTKTADEIIISGDKTFSQKLSTNNLKVQGGSWKESTDDASPINLVKLFNFLDSDTLDKVRFMGSLTFDNEPSVLRVNGADLSDIVDNSWMKNVAATINFPVMVDSASAAKLTIPGNEIIFQAAGVDIDLNDIEANYLSLTKEQNVPITLTFENGLAIDTTLRVGNGITLRDDGGVDKLLNIDDGDGGVSAVDIANLAAKAVYKNQAMDIPMKLIIDNVIATTSVNMDNGILTNGVDLSVDALTYIANDVKTFTNVVTLTGDLKSEEFVTQNELQFTSDELVSFGPQSHTGINYDPGTKTISMTVAAMIGNAVDNTVLDSEIQQVSGEKTFSDGFEVAELSVGTLNTLDIGDCSNPKIVLTASCSGTPQVVSGTYTLTNADFDDLNLNNLNGQDFTALEQNFIYYKEDGDIVFTGDNTFTKGLQAKNSGLTLEDMYGLKISELKSKNINAIDMSYKSGVDDVDPNALIDYIKTESGDVDARYLFAAQIEWKEDSEAMCTIFFLFHHGSSNPVQMLGIEKVDEVELKVNLYQPARQDFSARCTAHKMNPIKIFNAVTAIPAGDSTEMKAVSLPINDERVIVVLTGVKIHYVDTPQSGKVPLDQGDGAQINFGYISVHSIDSTNYIDSLDPADITMSLVEDNHAWSSIIDMKSIYVGEKKCIVLCRASKGVDILCWNDDDNGFESYQKISTLTCYSLSATPEVGNINKDGHSFISVYTGQLGAEVNILKLDTDNNEFVTVNEEPATPLTTVKLFSYKDGDEPVVLLTLLPENPQKSLNIFKYDFGDSKFKVYESLEDMTVLDVQFEYDVTDKLKMSILRTCTMKEQCVAVLQTFLNRRYTKFSTRDALESIRVSRNMNRFTIATNLNQRYAITRASGNEAQHSRLYNYVYERKDVAALREEFKKLAVSPPDFITLNCNAMVRDYLKKLYNDEPTYHLEEVADFFLNVMPRGHVEFTPNVITDENTRNYLAKPLFNKLLQPRAPVAAANMYAYDESAQRILFNDETYVGTYLLYKDADRVLYLYSKLLDDDIAENFRAVSFWTDCTDESAEEITYKQYSDVPARVTPDTDGLSEYQCSMVHDVDDAFTTKLTNLDNKANAGAIVIHKGTTKDTPRYACGYLKKPVTAKLQFYRDHDEKAIKLDPYTSYTL